MDSNILNFAWKVWLLLPIKFSVLFIIKGIITIKSDAGFYNIVAGLICLIYFGLYKLTFTYALPHAGTLDTIFSFVVNAMCIPIIIAGGIGVIERNKHYLYVFPCTAGMMWTFFLIRTFFESIS